jgi:hypothetical protein
MRIGSMIAALRVGFRTVAIRKSSYLFRLG